jgi:hypothetical protein
VVSPVDPTVTAARLAALMQQVFGASQRRIASGKRNGREKAVGGSVPGTDGKRLEQLLSKVGALDADQPHRRRAFARVLVEAVLTEEFGGAVVNEAGFQAVIDDVAMAIESNADTQPDLDRIIEQCTSLTGRPQVGPEGI